MTWYPSSFPFIASLVSGTGSHVTISAVELNGYACTFVIDMVGTGNKHYIDM